MTHHIIHIYDSVLKSIHSLNNEKEQCRIIFNVKTHFKIIFITTSNIDIYNVAIFAH